MPIIVSRSLFFSCSLITVVLACPIRRGNPMKFITTSTNKKRQMVYLPAVNPRSFLFFFEKGSSGNSWSLRDYSGQGEPTPKYAGDFGLTAEDVRQKAKYVFDAPTVDTNDIVFWSE